MDSSKGGLMKVWVRDYRPADARALTDIFYDTVHAVGVEHYTREQVLAWAPLPRDYDAWQGPCSSTCSNARAC